MTSRYPAPLLHLAVALLFLTRIPIRLDDAVAEDALSRAAPGFGVAGAIVGLAAGLAAGLAMWLHLPAGVVALMALAASIAVTGGLHEDGLADTADGFGGGATVARKLEIMRDSRIGTYGALALMLSLGLRDTAVASLTVHGFGAVICALVAAHAGARSGLPLVMAILPSARTDGRGAAAGTPSIADAGLAILLGILIVLLMTGFRHGLTAFLAGGLAMLAVVFLARRQIGGYTGDVLGAMEQAAEIAILLSLSAT